MTTERAHSVSVAGIVVRSDGQILVVQRRDNGHWEPPGGVLELDETIEEGVVREVVEETGLTVTPERLTGVYKNMAQGIVALVYRCRPEGTEVRPSDESIQSRWVRPDAIEDLMTPAYAVRVLDALNGSIHTRAHDGTNLLEQ